MSQHLLIDTATTTCFVGLINKNKIQLESINTGNIADNCFLTLEKLQTSTDFEFSDIDRITFNEGPGSTLGIRTCLMFIQIIWKFKGTLEIFKYNTFDFPFIKNEHTDNVILSYANGKYIHKNRNSDNINILVKEEAESLNNCVFINTKHTADKLSLPLFDYDIKDIYQSIIELSQATNTPQQFTIKEQLTIFQKWSPERHK